MVADERLEIWPDDHEGRLLSDTECRLLESDRGQNPEVFAELARIYTRHRPGVIADLDLLLDLADSAQSDEDRKSRVYRKLHQFWGYDPDDVDVRLTLVEVANASNHAKEKAIDARERMNQKGQELSRIIAACMYERFPGVEQIPILGRQHRFWTGLLLHAEPEGDDWRMTVLGTVADFTRFAQENYDVNGKRRNRYLGRMPSVAAWRQLIDGLNKIQRFS
jgi:hypothetical protein